MGVEPTNLPAIPTLLELRSGWEHPRCTGVHNAVKSLLEDESLHCGLSVCSAMALGVGKVNLLEITPANPN